MKCLKVLSFVAFLAPGLSYANEHATAPAATTPTAAPAAATVATPTTTPAPTSSEHGTVQAKAVTTNEKTSKKSFCAKSKEEAAAKCNTWVDSKKASYKTKFVDAKCSESTAAKACKTGSQAYQGEVKYTK